MMDERSMRLHQKYLKAIDRIRMGYYSDKYFRVCRSFERIITIHGILSVFPKKDTVIWCR